MDAKQIEAMLDRLAELNAAKDAITLQKQELIDQVITPEIKAKMAEIDAEFSPMIEAVTAQAAELEAAARDAVIAHGSTIKGSHLQAVYAKGRTSWDSKRLEGLMIALPQLSECRTIGAPSVSIRRI